tara:strand:- start:492 stop:884 length:393 start_codon:yes stop_codon:yes gene_type:complete
MSPSAGDPEFRYILRFGPAAASASVDISESVSVLSAVVIVDAKVAESEVNAPVDAVFAPIGLESMFAPSMFIATLVPVALKIASIVSRSEFNFVPHESVLAPTSGLVSDKFVVVVSAIFLNYPMVFVNFK